MSIRPGIMDASLVQRDRPAIVKRTLSLSAATNRRVRSRQPPGPPRARSAQAKTALSSCNAFYVQPLRSSLRIISRKPNVTPERNRESFRCSLSYGRTSKRLLTWHPRARRTSYADTATKIAAYGPSCIESSNGPVWPLGRRRFRTSGRRGNPSWPKRFRCTSFANGWATASR